MSSFKDRKSGRVRGSMILMSAFSLSPKVLMSSDDFSDTMTMQFMVMGPRMMS